MTIKTFTSATATERIRMQGGYFPVDVARPASSLFRGNRAPLKIRCGETVITMCVTLRAYCVELILK